MEESRYSSTFHILGLDGSEWAASLHYAIPQENSPWNPLDEGVGGAQSDLYAVQNKTYFVPAGNRRSIPE
jgi:hypothetical protein